MTPHADSVELMSTNFPLIVAYTSPNSPPPMTPCSTSSTCSLTTQVDMPHLPLTKNWIVLFPGWTFGASQIPDRTRLRRLLVPTAAAASIGYDVTPDVVPSNINVERLLSLLQLCASSANKPFAWIKDEAWASIFLDWKQWDVRDVVGRQQLAVTERVVGCVGGNGDAEHVPMWLCCKERFLYICGECDQISGWSA